jgi:hypothetical protein
VARQGGMEAERVAKRKHMLWFESLIVLEALVLGANHRLRPLRARSALASGQWDDGFTPSRGIWCEVTGDAHAYRWRKPR